ncbi:MAG: fused MFS/spermidine synthase, partial [Cyanobacteria bacterium]|nr:fused MFS/spermidine synthase [Cyanobacteriota bacterium]
MSHKEEFANALREGHDKRPEIWQNSYIILCISFFLSGACALAYEIVWQRVLIRLIGSSVPANSAILAIYMAGMGLGVLLWLAQRRRVASPIRAYALCELIIGVFGLASVWLCQSSTLSRQVLISGDALDCWQRPLPLILVAAFLFIPTTSMGATFPILSAFVDRQAGSIKRRQHSLNVLYAANTTGAVLGVILAGFVLLPAFGIGSSLILLSAINIPVGLVLLAFGLWGGRERPAASTDTEGSIGLLNRGESLLAPLSVELDSDAPPQARAVQGSADASRSSDDLHDNLPAGSIDGKRHSMKSVGCIVFFSSAMAMIL